MFAILAFVGMLGVFTFSGALPVQGQTYDAGDSDTDRAALVALYNATGGANWGNNGNWLSNAPMGEWHGVTTDSDGRVTHLHLYSNQLTGEIPAELGSLPSLEVLDLRTNQLTGEIPAELGDLTNLEGLDLYGNQLTGAIPAELGNLTNLRGLYLYGNQLTGAIPAELGDLSNLRVLGLNSNQLTGEIPAELGNLTNLQTLHLYSNQLTGEIPAELGSLTNLRWLHLSSNQLTGEIPAELGDLSNLRGLYLDRNQLTGAIPAELGDLSNLRVLGLNSNQLTGAIPAELGNLTNLEGLDLYGNQLTGEIPAELGDLSNLTELELRSNQLTGCIPEGLRNIRVNDFSSLGLPFCMPSAGDAATDRAALVALYNATGGANWGNNGNWLSNAPMGEWHGVITDSDGRVTHLDLRTNQLTGEIPVELGDLTNLTKLHLSGNQLSGEIPAELGTLTSLRWLWLSSNQLTGEIPAELGNLTSLLSLELYLNQLTGEIPAELGNLTSLLSLWLDRNQLTGEIPAELGTLTNLEWLVLSSIQLTGEIPAELGNLTNLTNLRLDSNQLTGEIPAELGNLTNLEQLRLFTNQLTGEIPVELGDLTSLEWLDLDSNQLTGEIPAELGGLTNLAHLSLYNNQLSGEIPAELGGLTNLAHLSLAVNQLTGLSGEIPAELGSLTNLEELRLNSNQLSGEIPAELGSLANLQGLHLDGNQLSGEIPAELGSLTDLEALFLSGNQLTGCIPVGIAGVANNDFNQLGLPFCAGASGAPTIGTLTPGADFLTITWAAPTGSSESAIIAYDLRYIESAARDKSDVNWTVVDNAWTAGSGALSYQIAGLTDGTQYDVQVRAVSAAGDGPWSATAPGTPATWGAIRSFSPPSVAPAGEVVVMITASGYGWFGTVTETLPPGFSYVSSSLSDSGVTDVGREVRFSLFGQTAFTYTVTASSAAGTYSFSGVLRNFYREDVPVGGALTIAVAAGAPLIVRYDANGNGMIEKNEVIAAINDYLFGEGDAAISKSDVIKLINLYLFAPSTPHNRPGAPEGLTAAGNGQTRIDLSWRAPASDGGAAITGYRIEVSENGSTWNDLVADTRNAATSYSHTGLTAGSTRHYRVSAINSAGTGPPSNIATGTTAGDAATDRAALAALYNATDGANWRNNGNWLSNAPMGEWHGVTTDSDGRVTYLNLHNTRLTGEIPSELGNLTYLEGLDLSSTRLTGEIPSELGNLTYLEGLDLSSNRLTGEIPAELGNLTYLERSWTSPATS